MTRTRFARALGAAGVVVGIVLALPGGPARAHDPADPTIGGTVTGPGSSHHMTLVSSSPAGDSGARPTSSDMAFWGDLAFVANYDGFRVFDVAGAVPRLLSDVRCRGAQGDPSVYDRDGNGAADLLVLSVDRTMTAPDCSGVPAPDHASPTGWEGLRLFDVSDPAAPRFLTGIYQDCGSHTNTLLPSGDRLLVLNSSYPLRPGPTCGPHAAPDRDAAHGVVQVVEIDLADPTRSREVAELPVVYPGDPDNRYRPIHDHGLNGGAVGGSGLIDGMRGCHDLSVFVELGLVAAACGEQAQLWRIDRKTGLPDTADPVWVYDQPNVDFWHSATFSWDGKYVSFIDESFGSGCPTTTVKRDLSTPDPDDVRQYATGNMFFLKVSNGKLLSEYRIPRGTNDGDTSAATQYCSSHLGAVVPARDRYLLVNGYYRGGTSVIDFSDPTDPREVAFHDGAGADTWAAYWYETRSPQPHQMRVYANDGVHQPERGGGFQAFVADVAATTVPLGHLNPQVQERVLKTTVSRTWKHPDGNPRSYAAGVRTSRTSEQNRPGHDGA